LTPDTSDMERIAVFPGSFDPITKGHESIIKRALPLFDRIVVAIGINSSKKYLFDLEQRKEWLREIFKDQPQITIATYQTLTVEFCREIGASVIIRGLRNSVDFNYEKSIAQMNRVLDSGIETIFYLTTPELSAINATIVRDIYVNGGEISSFIPSAITIPKIKNRS
jgi:pantetheine-phosphate adenylyltransferase